MENTINTPETLIFRDAKENDAPQPAKLFSNFWHQDEVAVLFGNQQSGKSLLAVQIAEAISSGKPLGGFNMDGEAQKVLYFDFDKSGYHFNQLYAGYQFSPNFRRLVVNKKNLDFKHLAEQFFFSVEELMCEEGAGVLIFDSLPTIKCFVKDSYFLKGIQKLKEYSDVSILLIGETKKEIKGKPLRLNHLDAHKQLMGFADSVFAMGVTSGEEDERYLIHLKSNERRIHNKNNVVTGRIRFSHAPFDFAQGDSSRTAIANARGVIPSVAEVQEAEACGRHTVTGVTPVTPFLPGFAFKGYNTESYVIAPPEGLELEILQLKHQQPELSFGQIAKQLKTNKMKVKRVVERYPVKSEILNVKFEILNSKSERLNVEPETGKANTTASSFSNPRLQPGGLENGKSSPCPLLSPAVLAQGGKPNAEPEPPITTLTDVAIPLLSDPFRGEVGLSDHTSDSGVKEDSSPNPLLLPTVPAQGGRPNAEPETPVTTVTDAPSSLPADPFRGGDGLSDHPSKSGVESPVTLNTKPETLNNKLTFSQRVKKQIAQKNRERMKSR